MTERLLLDVTVSAETLAAYRAGMPLASVFASGDTRWREIPARPANEVLAEAVQVAEYAAKVEDDVAIGEANNGNDILASHARDVAQENRDLAAQLRAMAAGPTWDEVQQAAQDVRAQYPTDLWPEGIWEHWGGKPEDVPEDIRDKVWRTVERAAAQMARDSADNILRRARELARERGET